MSDRSLMLSGSLIRSPLLARVLVLLLAAGSVLPVVVHGQVADDPLCAPVRDSARLVITGSSQVGAGEHCAVCHWLRGLRSFIAAGLGEPARHGVQAGAPVERASLPLDLTPDGRSVRAPPADSLS